MRAIFAAILAAAVALVSYGSVAAQQSADPQLGPAPTVTNPAELATSVPDGVSAAVAPVDRTNRQAVVDFYNTVYIPALNTPHGWTGSVSGCNAGTTTAAYANATMDMVNFFRAMVGLPSSLPHNPVNDAKAQEAALMMTANNSLSHAPPPSWLCYTAAGAEAAGKSNIALGVAGPRAVALYIEDPGASNTALGHRRWVLYPRQTEMATGSTDRANALWVIGNFGTRPATPEFVAWPPAGFVPRAVVYPRWSFSVNTDSSVSFTDASVTMTRNGSPVALTILPSAAGFGDSTLGWEPQGLAFPSGAPDQAVSVSVQNVVVGGVPRNYSYTVTVIDPALNGAPAMPVFTDPSLQARVTTVRAVHVIELRQRIAELRARYKLPAFSWTDPTLTARVTVIRAVHIVELRQALAAVYAAAGRAAPVYSTPAISAGGVIMAAHITELRAAVLAIWQ